MQRRKTEDEKRKNGRRDKGAEENTGESKEHATAFAAQCASTLAAVAEGDFAENNAFAAMAVATAGAVANRLRAIATNVTAAIADDTTPPALPLI